MEMSGLLKELHCPYEEAVSGILKGSTQNTKDHLKFVCMYESFYSSHCDTDCLCDQQVTLY